MILKVGICFTQANSYSDNAKLIGESYLDKADRFALVDYDSCHYYMLLANQFYNKSNDISKKVFCKNSLFVINYKKGIYDVAFNYVDTIRILLRNSSIVQDSTLAFTTGNLGAFERHIGNYKKSIDFYKLAMQMNYYDHEFFCGLYINLSVNYRLIGDYSKSILYAEKSYKIAKENNLSNNILHQATFSVFAAYLNIDPDIAIEKSSEVLFMLDHGNRIIQREEKYIELFKRLCTLSLKTNNFELAKTYLSKIKTILDKNPSIDPSNYLRILAKYFRETQNLYEFDIAMSKALDNISTKSELSFRTFKLDLLILKAEFYLEMQKYDFAQSAIEEFESALSVVDFFSYNELNIIKCRYLKCKFELETDLISSDLDSDISSLLHTFRLQNSAASHKSFWASEHLEIYESVIRKFLSFDDLHSAFSFAEENKSNLLLQSLNDLEAKSYAGIPEELLEEERSLRAEKQFYEKKLFELKQAETIDSIKVSEFSEIIADSDLRITAIVDSFETHYPEYYELKYNQERLTVEDVQSMLDSETGFLEYFVGKDSTYLFSISDDDINYYAFEHLDSLDLSYYYQYLRNPESDLSNVEREARYCYDFLLKDALNDLGPSIKKLVIVPDSKLNNIPFELLQDEEGEYIINKYDIGYQYSGRLWRLLKQRKSTNNNYDLVAYAYNSNSMDYLAERACTNMTLSNLLCSQSEVDAITEILGSDNVISQHSSTEDLFDKASEAKIIHLATHACMDYQNSDYSRIFFEDQEINNIDLQLKTLNADLAVLSACESGYGELIEGEGAMSLSKGFFHAGCKSTLVSLWPVDDCSTSEVMAYFYKEIKDGKNKDEALKQAKLNYVLSAHPSRKHPYYWAGFVLIGDVSPIDFSEPTSYWRWLISLSVALIIYLFLKNKFRQPSKLSENYT